MKIPKLTFEEFVCLPEDERIELQIALSYTDYKVNCREWTHGQVKDAQDTIKEDMTYKDILDIVELEIKDCAKKPFHIVLGTFYAIKKSIQEISQLEADNLSGELSAKEMTALAQMGGFDKFKHFPETDSLAEGKIWMHEAVRAQRWDLCFAKLLYNKALSNYQKELNK